MKKLLVLTLALILTLSLTACSGDTDTPSGNGGDNSTTPPASNNGDNTTPNGGDTNAVAGYLARFGLTEDDIKPDGFDSFEGPEGWLIKVNAGEGKANTWGKQIYDKIKAISDDGKVYDQGYPTFKDEASWSDGGTIYQWAFVYNGKTVEVDVTPPGDTPTQYRIALHFQ